MSALHKINSFFRLFKQALRGDTQDYTTGSIDKAIVLLSIPMILEMSMESLFAVVDVYFVSQLHDNDAVATVGLTESVLTLIYSLAMGLSMGATAMVARRVGEKNIKSARVAAMQAIYICLGLSVLISVVGCSLVTSPSCCYLLSMVYSEVPVMHRSPCVRFY
jgi:Na+-driven multidrug efflux pump